MCVAFHPNGKLLFSGGSPGPLGGQVKRWDVATGRGLQSHDGPSDKVLALADSKFGHVAAAAFSPDEKWLATGGDDQTVRLYDVPKGGLPSALNGHQGRIQALAFHPDGEVLASAAAEEEEIILWDIPGRKEKARLKGHT